MVRMLCLIDGYNVTKGDPATHSLSLQAQREALVARLRVRGTELLGRGRIVVVFDGNIGESWSNALKAETHPIEVTFSHGVSADDAIVAYASRSGDTALCIVTSDRGLADRVRAHTGASVEVRPRESVYEGARGLPRKKARGALARDAGLPPGANKITKELKDLWLDSEE